MKLLDLAYECCEDGDFEEALNCYDKVLKEDPQNIVALIDKGTTLQNMGKVKNAMSLYDQALLINPKHVDAILNMGAALHTLNRYDDRALKIDKKCAMALAYKGLSLGEQGKIPQAIENFKKALAIDKDYDLAKLSKDMAQDLLKAIRKERNLSSSSSKTQ